METNKIKVELPDGKSIDISEECLKTPMLLFDPIENDKMQKPIQELIHETIQKLCDPDKKEILDRVKNFMYVTGGTTNMTGFMDVFSEKINTSKKDLNMHNDKK